jgi:hypothetical protein
MLDAFIDWILTRRAFLTRYFKKSTSQYYYMHNDPEKSSPVPAAAPLCSIEHDPPRLSHPESTLR